MNFHLLNKKNCTTATVTNTEIKLSMALLVFELEILIIWRMRYCYFTLEFQMLGSQSHKVLGLHYIILYQIHNSCLNLYHHIICILLCPCTFEHLHPSLHIKVLQYGCTGGPRPSLRAVGDRLFTAMAHRRTSFYA